MRVDRGLRSRERSGDRGVDLDPQRHEAIISEQTTTVPDGHVVRELQRGYEISGRVLRPALVAVADNATPTGAA